jgi:S-adenosyl-L-methionine hydrolase (adenosine-forming)
MAIITLLTDFGTRDEYVGALKGVILGIHPQVTLVDVSHHIPPRDIVAAGHTLRSVYRYFPEGTLHVAVVDPGVGSNRSILAVRFNGYLLMAPDNGLLPLVWADQLPQEIVRVENQMLFRHPVSRTFHGRDIFAPVAAHLSKGYPLVDVGSPMTPAQVFRLDHDEGAGISPSGVLVGTVVSVDRFGNLITNIEAAQVDQLMAGTESHGLVIQVGACRIDGLAISYCGAPVHMPLALVGSRNCIEIAVNGGSAALLLGVGHGTKVHIKEKG